jgi:hypothetical protein
MTPDEKSRAQRDLEAIDRLQRNSDFTGYFLRRLSERIAAQESFILGQSFLEADFPKAKAALAELYSVRGLMEADAAGCRSLLGLGRDEIPLG